MPSLLEWLVKERCLWHAEPMFDRDLTGHAVFRCPRCMATWPILPNQSPRRPLPAPLLFEVGRRSRSAAQRRAPARRPRPRVGTLSPPWAHGRESAVQGWNYKSWQGPFYPAPLPARAVRRADTSPT